MSWVLITIREPRQGQWIVVPWGDGFKAGQFDKNHPFSPCIVDRQTGKFYRYFHHWKPLTLPRSKS